MSELERQSYIKDLKTNRFLCTAIASTFENLEKEKGFEKAKTELKLYLKDKKELGEDFTKEVEDLGEFVLLCPGSTWKTKRWKKIKNSNLHK